MRRDSGRARVRLVPMPLHNDRGFSRWGNGVCFHQTMESRFQCASCGVWNVTSVDESAGRRQSYVEDCQVCCKPNLLRIEYDNSAQEFFITAKRE